MTKRTSTSVQVEMPILSLRRHGRALTLPVLVLLALAAAAGYFVGRLPESWMNWAAGLGAVALSLLLGIGPLLSWLVNRSSITTRRVVLRRGFFVHRRTEIPLSRVREVRLKRGPLQRMFRSGDVELVVGAKTPTVLRDVPGVMVVADALQELIEADYLNPLQTDAGQHDPAVVGSGVGASGAGVAGGVGSVGGVGAGVPGMQLPDAR